MLQLSFFYNLSRQSGHYYNLSRQSGHYYNLSRQLGHYYSLFELGYMINRKQTWSVFDQGLKSKNVVFCIFQLFEVSHEKN